MGLMVGKVKSDRNMAISLGVDPVRYDKGDIVFNGAIRKEDRRCEAVFSSTLYRMRCNGNLSPSAYEKAREICETIEALEGSQFKSMLDTDVIASAAGKSANKVPVGVTDVAMDRARKVREWKVVAGEFWPALAGVCAFGMTLEDAAKHVRRGKVRTAGKIRRLLEEMR